MLGPSDARSQSGLDRLVVFVVAVVIVVLVTPFVLGFLGVDVDAPQNTDAADAGEMPEELVVLGVRGDAVDDNRSSLGQVRVIVAPRSGHTPVNLTGGSAIWVDEEVHHLRSTAERTGEDDGEYELEVEGSTTPPIHLEETTDRATFVFDLGTDDVDGLAEFGTRLEAGETASVTIVTGSGSSITRELVVPASLPEDRSVGL